MSNLTSFLLGFLCAAAMFAVFIVWYYRRARGRVRAIQESIRDYAKAKHVVGAAIDSAYPKEQ